jgi:hypothetical protein
MQNFIELLKDHALILASTRSLTGVTRTGRPDPETAYLSLRHLARLLESHLRAEGEFIHADHDFGHDDFAALAHQHGQRFNDLVQEWGVYLREWTQENIRHDWETFVWATDWMVERLNEQVEAENESLYPAALRYGLIRLLPQQRETARAGSRQAAPKSRFTS